MRIQKIFPILFILLSGAIGVSANDTLTIKLKLANVSPVLIFNQNHVPGNTEEYRWEVLIDSDNNLYTGNTAGYDVGFVLTNTKLPGSISYTGTIISGSEMHTVLYNGNSSVYGHELSVFFGDNDSCLHIKALKEYAEVACISAGNRMTARTCYYGASGNNADETGWCSIPGQINDAQADVMPDFADILSVSVENLYTKLNEHGGESDGAMFYPNPANEKIFKAKKSVCKVFDLNGQLLMIWENSEFDLNAFPAGIYFIRDEELGLTEKLILTKF